MARRSKSRTSVDIRRKDDHQEDTITKVSKTEEICSDQYHSSDGDPNDQLVDSPVLQSRSQESGFRPSRYHVSRLDFLQNFEMPSGRKALKWCLLALKISLSLLATIICMVWLLLFAAAWLHWDNCASLFPSVCLAEDFTNFQRGPLLEAQSNFTQVIILDDKILSSTPREMKKQRRAIFRPLYYIREIHKNGEMGKVDFELLDRRMQMVLDLMEDFAKDLVEFLYRVKRAIRAALKQYDEYFIFLVHDVVMEDSAEYHSKYGTEYTLKYQRRLRTRSHVRECKAMLDELVEASKPIKFKLSQLEEEILSLSGLIQTAVTSLEEHKDSTISSWSRFTQLNYHYGLLGTPLEILYLLYAIDGFNELHALDLMNTTMAATLNLDSMTEAILKGKAFLHMFEGGEEKQLSWIRYWVWRVFSL